MSVECAMTITVTETLFVVVFVLSEEFAASHSYHHGNIREVVQQCQNGSGEGGR